MAGRNGQIDRRQALGVIAAAAAGGALPGAAFASFPAIEEMATSRARALADGRGVGLRLLIPDGCGDNVRVVTEGFSAATGIPISIATAPVDDINTRLSLDWMGGTSDYDVVLPATFGVPDLAAAGVLRPVDDFAGRHEPRGYREGFLYTVGDRFDGRLYGFQTDGDAYLMFYNDDFLSDPAMGAEYEDRFGTPLDVPQTWQELDRQMAFFHRPDEGRFGGALFRSPGYAAWEWWVRFHAKGAWPLSEDLVPQIAGEAGVTALEEMIRATNSLADGVGYFGLFENWERFARGDIYCNIGWGGTQKYFNRPDSPVRGRLRYGPTPGGVVDGRLLVTPYFNWGWTYAVSAASPEPEIAYLLTLYASGADLSSRSVSQQGGFFDPFRAEHYDDPDIREIYGDAFLTEHRRSMEGAIPDLYLANQSQYLSALNDWLHRALVGDLAPDVALNRAAQAWDLIGFRAGRAAQVERWLALRENYPAAVRPFLKDL